MYTGIPRPLPRPTVHRHMPTGQQLFTAVRALINLVKLAYSECPLGVVLFEPRIRDHNARYPGQAIQIPSTTLFLIFFLRVFFSRAITITIRHLRLISVQMGWDEKIDFAWLASIVSLCFTYHEQM